MVEVTSFLIIAIIIMVVFFIIFVLTVLLKRRCRRSLSEIDQNSSNNSQANIRNLAFRANDDIKLHQKIHIQFSSQYQQEISNDKRMSLANNFLLPSEFVAQYQRRNSQLSVTSSRSGSTEVRRDIGSPSSAKKLVRFDGEGGSSTCPPRKMSYSYPVYNHASTKRPLKPILKSPTIHTFKSFDGFDRTNCNGLRICRIARNTAETIV